MLPIVLGFILVLAFGRRRMGSLVHTPVQTLVGWTTLVVVTASVVLLLASQVFGVG